MNRIVSRFLIFPQNACVGSFCVSFLRGDHEMTLRFITADFPLPRAPPPRLPSPLDAIRYLPTRSLWWVLDHASHPPPGGAPGTTPTPRCAPRSVPALEAGLGPGPPVHGRRRPPPRPPQAGGGPFLRADGTLSKPSFFQQPGSPPLEIERGVEGVRQERPRREFCKLFCRPFHRMLLEHFGPRKGADRNLRSLPPF